MGGMSVRLSSITHLYCLKTNDRRIMWLLLSGILGTMFIATKFHVIGQGITLAMASNETVVGKNGE